MEICRVNDYNRARVICGNQDLEIEVAVLLIHHILLGLYYNKIVHVTDTILWISKTEAKIAIMSIV